MQRINIVADSRHAPIRQHSTDAGADLKAAENTVILPGYAELVTTGVKVAIPPGYVGYIYSRSGLSARQRVRVANGVGVIDSDYRGPIKVQLENAGDQPFEVTDGDRIAQLVIQKVELPTFTRVTTLETTDRGEGGHGSTGT